MYNSQAAGQDQANLTALVESIVNQVLGDKLDSQLKSWAANNSNIISRMSYFQTPEGRSGTSQAFEAIGQMGAVAKYDAEYWETQKNNSTTDDAIKQAQTAMKHVGEWAKGLSGLAGMYSAYQSGDALGGAMAGFQLGSSLTFLGKAGGPIGAGLGLLAGLLSPGIDRWQRPTFTPADQAYNKLFTIDRGERNLYDMPDSFYFRTGWNNSRKIVVNIGNNQFDDHIRDSLTNSYASQLNRGLVF